MSDPAETPRGRASADAGSGGWAGLFVYMAVAFVANAVLCTLAAGIFVEQNLESVVDLYGELFTAIRYGEYEPLLVIAAISGGFVLLQAIFLLPIYRPPAVARRGRSLRKSVVMVSFVVAGISAAVVWAVAELLSGERDFIDAGGEIFFILPAVVLVLSWILWGLYFWRISKPFDPAAIDRLMLPLLRCSAIGMVLIVPIDALVRRKRECYCATGSFLGLAFGVGAVIWLLGPFAVIGLSRARRLALRRHVCLACGHDRPPNASARCQECGRGWTRRKRLKA